MANKRIQNLIATKAEWESKNPVLKKGEYGIEVEYTNFKITDGNIKVGDGLSLWTELPYVTTDTYKFTELVSTAIGGLTKDQSLEGLEVTEIIRQLVTPYIKPAFTSFKANNVSTINYEVGTKLPTNFNLTWAISEIQNTINNSGIISSSDINAFTNLGSVNLNNLIYTLNSAVDYTYNLPDQITLSIDGRDSKNALIGKRNINFNWLGRIRYGIKATESVSTSTDVSNLANSFLGDKNASARLYNFTAGYPFILIPTFIDTSNIKFIDEDNQLDFSMALQSQWNPALPSTVSFNNGNTSYSYYIYRGEFFYNSPVNIRIEYGN